jgi:hypothetical protein
VRAGITVRIGDDLLPPERDPDTCAAYWQTCNFEYYEKRPIEVLKVA